MKPASLSQTKTDRILQNTALVILILGIVVRFVVYLQNRNLFIDEANVARNIFEQGFAGLAKPLKYEQYAPPVFLWLVKLCALMFGYGEYALRIYPLLAGVGSICVFYLLLRDAVSFRSLWYPLMLFAFGFTFIRYSSELKQYISDVFVVLLLIYFALKKDIEHVRPAKFLLFWVVAGSVAVWTSMPAVFALAGVGAYYFVLTLQKRKYRSWPLIIFVSIVWVVQFAIYYVVILKPQANSDYLQNYHKAYFLFLLPNGKEQLLHNWYVFRETLQEASGYADLAWLFNLILLIVGIVALFRKNAPKAVLLIVPILATLLAAALKQYSLMTRLTMFMMTLLLLFIGYGLEALLKARHKYMQVVAVVFCLFFGVAHNMLKMLFVPWSFEQITTELNFLKAHNIKGDEVYVHNGARPAFIYYTQIYPGKQKWQQLSGAHLLSWDASYDSLARHAPDTSAFIYTALGRDELDDCKKIVERHLREISRLEIDNGRKYAYIYVKK
jgi:4-amino-4-deoxy-L-arabinose transferase-like glycosyltransferase